LIPCTTTGWSVDAADHHLQRSLWEAILAAELARVVDRLLDDPVFIQPFRVHFDTRLAGGMPDGASRLISLHDPDVGPLRKGRIGPPVEFGYKAQVLDNPTGSCSNIRSWSATHPTPRCWPPPSGGSSPAPGTCHGR
jgi:hypothetical protein